MLCQTSLNVVCDLFGMAVVTQRIQASRCSEHSVWSENANCCLQPRREPSQMSYTSAEHNACSSAKSNHSSPSSALVSSMSRYSWSSGSRPQGQCRPWPLIYASASSSSRWSTSNPVSAVDTVPSSRVPERLLYSLTSLTYETGDEAIMPGPWSIIALRST